MDGHRCWAEVNLDAIRGNAAEAARRMGPGARVMAVIKASAYGHGLKHVARARAPNVEFLGVASVAEALALKPELREETRLFLLGPVLPEERALVVEHGFVPSLSTLDEARHYQELAASQDRRIPVHLILDTGMGRIGFTAATLPKLLAAHHKLSQLVFEGIASHFPVADEDRDFTLAQIAVFKEQLAECHAAGMHPRYIHIANSAGVLAFSKEIRALIDADTAPPDAVTLVRPGLMLYGVSPIPEAQSTLLPALSLKARVTLVRELPPGHGVSYGRTFVTHRDRTRVATLAIGYGDGYPRHLSGRDTAVLLQGRRCPLLGRVTMDQIMIDVTGLDPHVQPGDEAVLIGSQGDETILATELAEKADTISWEILTRITRRVPRIYTPL